MRHHNSDKLDAVLMVLIAEMEWDSTLANAIEEEIDNGFPFPYSAAEAYPFYTPRSHQSFYEDGYDPGEWKHPNYIRLLNWCLEDEEKPALEIMPLFRKALVPLLYINIF